MPYTVLTRMTAFSSGADLWIVPDINHSQWSQKIDWEVGFQAARAKGYVPPETPLAIKEIATELKIKMEDFRQTKAAPLLLATENHLPNKMTVFIQVPKNKSQWVMAASEIWKQLNFPELRVFLPEGVDVDEFKSAWPHPGFDRKITLVPTF
ncbi:MAG: hypothetical protein SGJ18_08665 [Pseudomonadota bacterium]|nr:hypothetical protein [Pseudomonadota bacterium]